MSRYALLQKVAKGLGKMVWDKGLPQSQNVTNLAMRLGPEALFAGASGTVFAPENATLGERFALGAEDFGIGVGMSLLGGGAGRGIAAKTARKGVSPKQLASRMDTGQTLGDVFGGVGMIAVPRPITQGVYEASAMRANESEEQVRAAQQEMLEQEMLAQAALSVGIPGLAYGAKAAAPGVTSAVTSAMNLTG